MDYPTEEQQFLVYKKVLESMATKKVVIRTLDIGADKQVDYFNLAKEENPALGYRAIRICLTRPEIFKTQLRALYRASAYGNLGIMFPMITSVSELEKILAICAEVRAELVKENIEISDNVELGIMIETPAAAVISEDRSALVFLVIVGVGKIIVVILALNDRLIDVTAFKLDVADHIFAYFLVFFHNIDVMLDNFVFCRCDCDNIAVFINGGGNSGNDDVLVFVCVTDRLL